MGWHKGKPGLGTTMLSPDSQRTAMELNRAPEQPKVRITSFSVNG